MTTATPSPFILIEPYVAEVTGLPLSEVKKRRSPNRCQKNGRTHLWSHDGLQDLERELAEVATEVVPEPAKTPEPQIWTVARRRTPRVLHVVRDGEPYDPRTPMCVWLPRPVAHLFVPKMRIAAFPRPGNDMVLDYAGHPDPEMRHRRFPRRPGKW